MLDNHPTISTSTRPTAMIRPRADRLTSRGEPVTDEEERVLQHCQVGRAYAGHPALHHEGPHATGALWAVWQWPYCAWSRQRKSIAANIPTHISRPTGVELAAVCGSSPASEAAAATTVEAAMPTDISTVCRQGCRRMAIQAAIPMTISAVISSADASGDRKKGPRPNADRSRPSGSNMPRYMAMPIWT